MGILLSLVSLRLSFCVLLKLFRNEAISKCTVVLMHFRQSFCIPLKRFRNEANSECTVALRHFVCGWEGATNGKIYCMVFNVKMYQTYSRCTKYGQKNIKTGPQQIKYCYNKCNNVIVRETNL